MKEKKSTNSKWGRISVLVNNKKAFTLIELLAIIVILAIIAVITIPILLNVIENSRKGAAIDSAYGFKDSINKYYIDKLSGAYNLKLQGDYEVRTNGKLYGDFGVNGNEERTISVSGTMPSSGFLTYSNNVLTGGCLVIGEYEVKFGLNGSVINTEKGTCEVPRYNFVYWNGSQPQEWATQGYLGYLNDATEPDLSWRSFARENLNTHVKEGCGRISNGDLVCVEPNKWDSNDSEGGDYIKSIVDILRSYGADCQYYYGINGYDGVSCYKYNVVPQFEMQSNGLVKVSGYLACGVYSNGNMYCVPE